jgi:hypothetical protein
MLCHLASVTPVSPVRVRGFSADAQTREMPDGMTEADFVFIYLPAQIVTLYTLLPYVPSYHQDLQI